MKTKLEIRDRSRDRETITGYSRDNLVRRMFGSTAYGINIRIDEPFTVVKSGGRVVGSAIIHEA